ncbi:MAG: thioredoxin family protein [bacterium]|nr:thioredoxin family protein [bacterium]
MRDLRLLTPALVTTLAVAQQATVEFGKIDWQRDYAAAKAASERSGKPLLLLFQEVPG